MTARPPADSGARVVVSGYMLRHPAAGNILAFFHYILGLVKLGHEVVYLEESGWPYSSYDPVTREWREFPTTGVERVRALLARCGVEVPVHFVNRDTGQTTGIAWDALEPLLASADFLLNIGGVCWLPQFDGCPCRVLVDMDPLFSQVDGFASKVLHRHDVLFSYGTRIGQPDCPVPARGRTWLPLVPPVVPELWAGGAPAGHPRFTTLANWTAYGSVIHAGQEFGQKDVEFDRLLELPRMTGSALELALAGAGQGVLARFRSAGWSAFDAGEVGVDVSRYMAYIRGSSGELSAAKHAYVKARTGWFSDRSVSYLAAGLPVVLQDTGFSESLPVGSGLHAFTSLDEAAAALERVISDYGRERSAAAALARDVFSSDVVLPKMLDDAAAARSAVCGAP